MLQLVIITVETMPLFAHRDLQYQRSMRVLCRRFNAKENKQCLYLEISLHSDAKKPTQTAEIFSKHNIEHV